MALLVGLLACKQDEAKPPPPANGIKIAIEGFSEPATITIDAPATWQSDLRNGAQFWTVPGAMLVGVDGFREPGQGPPQMTNAIKHRYEGTQVKREDLPGGRAWTVVPGSPGMTIMASLFVPFQDGIVEARVAAKDQAVVDQVKAVFSTIAIATPAR